MPKGQLLKIFKKLFYDITWTHFSKGHRVESNLQPQL